MSLLPCNVCHRELPLALYPDDKIICETCQKGIDTAEAEQAIKDKAKTLASELVALNSEGIIGEIDKVRNVLANVYGSFGGPAAFADHLYWVINELSQRKPVPATVGFMMLQLMKLHHQIEQTEEQTLAREMTDEQLRRETELATVKMFVESAGDPEQKKMLEEILGKHGLRIEKMEPEEILAEIRGK